MPTRDAPLTALEQALVSALIGAVLKRLEKDERPARLTLATGRDAHKGSCEHGHDSTA